MAIPCAWFLSRNVGKLRGNASKYAGKEILYNITFKLKDDTPLQVL